ncbi:MAG TPA: hypothetical protein VL117_12775 [Thermoleophilia bacterium]|nr:hypothetical protein [Thermoleophilia bacterium]
MTALAEQADHAARRRGVLALSVGLQLVLALLFGHANDSRVFMATGYLVAHGRDPYVALNLSRVFHHPGFSVIKSVGYPPPWPLLTGLLYAGLHAVSGSFLLYNLALKLPVIAADVGLAYLAAAVLQRRGASPAVCRWAWTFLLLNPFLLYVGAAWGEIDAIVALLALAALWALGGATLQRSTGRAPEGSGVSLGWRPRLQRLVTPLGRWRLEGSALLLALAVCVKPTALPLLAAAVLWLAGGSFLRAARYAAVCLAGMALFYVAPFFVFGWSRAPFTERLNAHLVLKGSLSFMTVVRLAREPWSMQGHWWLLGLLWLPALALAVLLAGRGDGGFEDLLAKGTAFVLVVFLTRSWLAEPDVVLVLPLALVLTGLGILERRFLTALWVVPLLFTVFNVSPLQLLWVAWPSASMRLLDDAGRYASFTLDVRAGLVVLWQVTGWWIVVTCLRRRPAPLSRAVLGEAPA